MKEKKERGKPNVVRTYYAAIGGASGALVLTTWLGLCYQVARGMHLGFRAMKMMKGREAKREIKEKNRKRGVRWERS